MVCVNKHANPTNLTCFTCIDRTRRALAGRECILLDGSDYERYVREPREMHSGCAGRHSEVWLQLSWVVSR